MKARVLASIPERVLTYAIDEAIQPRLSAALKKLHIEEYQVSPEELGESVGHLAGLPGFNEKRLPHPLREQLSPAAGCSVCAAFPINAWTSFWIFCAGRISVFPCVPK